MCTDSSHRVVPAGPSHDAVARDLADPAFRVDLAPVDSVSVTILMDNVVDALMPNHGPARRPRMPPPFRVPAATMVGGSTFAGLRAEHGFSCLVTVHREGHQHRILFDTGVSPDGMVDNMGADVRGDHPAGLR